MDKQKFSICSIVGAPNAGKSSFLNSFLGQKVSIVSPKVQTTRSSIRGIYCKDNLQTLLVDTPGIFHAKRTFERSIVKTAYAGLEEGADFCLHIFDGRKGITEDDLLIMDSLKKQKKVVINAVINKIDKISNEELLLLAKRIYEHDLYKEVFMISALYKRGLEDISTFLERNSNYCPWSYDEDEITTAPSKFLASETTREKIYLNIHKEIPYNITVETEQWIEEEKILRINQVIYVNKEGYKKIILGAKGETIKKIGTQSRYELEDLFEKKIHLVLFVKVKENWKTDSSIYKYMGMLKD